MLHATGVDKSSPQSKLAGLLQPGPWNAPHPLGPATGEGSRGTELGRRAVVGCGWRMPVFHSPDPHEPLPQRAIDEKSLQAEPWLAEDGGDGLARLRPLAHCRALQDQGRGRGCRVQGAGWSITGKQRKHRAQRAGQDAHPHRTAPPMTHHDLRPGPGTLDLGENPMHPRPAQGHLGSFHLSRPSLPRESRLDDPALRSLPVLLRFLGLSAVQSTRAQSASSVAGIPSSSTVPLDLDDSESQLRSRQPCRTDSISASH